MKSADNKKPSDYLTDDINQWAKGDLEIKSKLFEVLYPELKVIAKAKLRGEMFSSLSSRSLVHEAYIKLEASKKPHFVNRKHFFAIAARTIQQILIDQARKKKAEKRAAQKHDTDVETCISPQDDEDPITALDQGLGKLKETSPRAAQVAQLRIFTGCTFEEIADILEISVSTTKNDWRFAQAWLFDFLNPDPKNNDLE